MSTKVVRKVAQVVNVAWGQAFVAVAALVGIRLFTELLGPGPYGAAMLAQGALILLDSVGVMALSQTLLARCGPIVDPERRLHISVGLSGMFIRRVGPVVIALALIAGITVAASTRDWWWLLLPIFIFIYVLSGTIKSGVLSLIILRRAFRTQSAWAALESALSISGVAAVLVIWRADSLGYIAGYTTASLASTLIFASFLSPDHLRRLHKSRADSEVGAAISYGLPVAAMGPLGWVSTYLDRYILGTLLGTADVGLYAATTGLVARPYSLTTAILTNYYRPFYFSPSESLPIRQQRARILFSWVLTSVTIGVAGVVVTAILGETLARVALAPEFQDGAHILMLLFAISQTFAITTHAADNAVLAMGGSRRLLQTQLAVSALTIVFIPLGVLSGGLIGGLVGRCCAELSKTAVAMVLAVRMIRGSSQVEVELPTKLEV